MLPKQGPIQVMGGADIGCLFLPCIMSLCGLQGQYYKAFVSLLRSTYTAVIDFNVIIPCGMYCDGNVVQSAVSYVNSGLQVRREFCTGTDPLQACGSKQARSGHRVATHSDHEVPALCTAPGSSMTRRRWAGVSC